MSLKKLWNSSSGPQSRKEALWLYLKGFCMGSADVIPGVSGGTIAFITGIYDKLLAAVASMNMDALKAILKLDFKALFSQVHVKFLVILGIGVVSAIISTARLMHYLIVNFPIFTWAAFFGLIAGSILIVSKDIENKFHVKNMISVIIGAVSAYVIIGLIPVQTPNDKWFIFLCGIIGITAMILPGISGSFLLLILGKYEFVTGAVKAPFAQGNLPILLIFLCGTTTGLLSVAKLLNYFYKKYRLTTLAVMTGFMMGSLRKVWPWKEVLETKVVRGKTLVLREANIWPQDLNSESLAAILLMIVGFAVVLLIDRLTHKPA